MVEEGGQKKTTERVRWRKEGEGSKKHNHGNEQGIELIGN
jgi:hypothetical protein